MSEHPDEESGYSGPATLVVQAPAGSQTDLSITVTMRGHYQPIDGIYRWYGRISASPELSALLGARKASCLITTPHGQAHGEISDPDPWHRYRISGVSTPPFAVENAPATTP